MWNYWPCNQLEWCGSVSKEMNFENVRLVHFRSRSGSGTQFRGKNNNITY